MGDRGEIVIEDSGVHFYTHWGASELHEVLAAALKRGRDRWDDYPYLSRIIFSEMIRDDIDGLTGFGIDTHTSDVRRSIVVNCQERIVTVDDEVYSFEEFVKE